MAPWYWVLFGLSGMFAGLLGNLIDDPTIMLYFVIYFSVTMLVVVLTLSRILVAKVYLSIYLLLLLYSRNGMQLLLIIVQHIPFLKRFERPLLHLLIKMRQTSVIFFTKTDKIHILNKAVLYLSHHFIIYYYILTCYTYAHQNEMCDHIKLIHIYNDESDIPSQLKENHCILNNKDKGKKINNNKRPLMPSRHYRSHVSQDQN